MAKIFNVVIVDDNKSLSYIIRDRIEQKKAFQVQGIAHNGADGIKLIERVKPDIVILDIIMPQADGLTVLEHFNGQKGIEFIVLSAIGHDLVTKRAVSLGAMYYLVKPFEVDVLMDRMNSLLLGVENNPNIDRNVQIRKDAIEQEISKLGVPMHVKGFQYLLEGVLLALDQDDMNFKITKCVYPVIAREYDTTPTSVERAIRNAIDLTISRADSYVLNEYFNHELFNNKITNKEFIIRIASNVKSIV